MDGGETVGKLEESSVGKERDESDYPQAISHGFPSVHDVHASHGTGHHGTEGKPPGNSSVGKERYGSDDRVDGGETVGNSLGRAPLGGAI